ncbi:MAG: response regulator transcription factor [Flavobacteriaceae bacterium]|nr:response regulator transcription factor [Flavobacteriaceae bacterium]
MIKYITVDDENASHDIIMDYASNLSYLSHQKSCYNAFEAIEYLNDNEVDLIFLDINMPKLSGFDFLKTLTNPPKIIVTTAHKEFALEGYELNISDYLLKPFSFNRFLAAVNKVNHSISKLKEEESNSIFLKDSKKHFQVKLDEILFAEADGNYIKIHLNDKTITTHHTLSYFEELLPKSKFIKVHKSFIIAKDKIVLIEGNLIHIDEYKIPVGKTYKQDVKGLFL